MTEYDSWYKWGKATLYVEMLIAVIVTVFSLYMAFNGMAGWLV